MGNLPIGNLNEDLDEEEFDNHLDKILNGDFDENLNQSFDDYNPDVDVLY